jgi:flagellar biosynthesis/type III secretory pathway protein FliH
LLAGEKTLFKQESMTTGGKKNLTLVKPDGPLFVPPERTGLFHEDLTDTPPAGAFQSGLPEKAIELPGPLVQQAIARAIAGLSESQAFQAMDTSKMAKVNRLAHKVPKDAVHEEQVDAEKLLGEDEAKGNAKGKLESKTEDSEVSAEQTLASGEQVAEERVVVEPAVEEEALEAQAFEAAEDQDAVDGDSEQAEATELATPNAEEALEDEEPLREPLPDEGEQAPETLETTEAPEISEASEASETSEAPEISEIPETSEVSEPEALQQVSRSDLEQLHQEAFEAGRQAGLDEMANTAPPPPSEEMLEAAREEAFQKGYEEGYTKAEAAVKDELQAEVELAAQNLNDFTSKLAEAARDTDTFYAPLLNLSMHLAEQLVRGELTLSSKAIQRLIETCLMEFEQEATAPVVVRMHPDDLARIEQDDALLPKNIILRADPNLLIGSVKVQMNGALIEDLMQHRAQVLWQALMQGQEAGDLPDSFLRNVALVKEAFDEVASPGKAVDPFTLDEAVTQESTSEQALETEDSTQPEMFSETSDDAKFAESDSSEISREIPSEIPSEIPTEISDDAKKGEPL